MPQDYSSLEIDQIRAKDEVVASGMMDGSLAGIDLAMHLIRLANTAFSTGSAEAAELLENWGLNPPTKDALHRAWALFELLYSGFWNKAEKAFVSNTRTEDGRLALLYLVDGHHVTPEPGRGYMMLDLPPETLKKSRAQLSGQEPWLEEDELAKTLADAFRKYINDQRIRSGGGWEPGFGPARAEEPRGPLWQSLETWLAREAQSRGRLWLVLSAVAALILALLALLL